MKHVFISYEHNDSDFAHNLVWKIKEGGFIPWVDDHIQGGQEWRKEIDQAIKDAFALIVIMSPRARASEYVTYEWAFALGAEVKVIPVLYKKTPLHPCLEALQYLDFTNSKARPWDKLSNIVKHASNIYNFQILDVPRDTPPHINHAIETLYNDNHKDRQIKAVEILSGSKHSIIPGVLRGALDHSIAEVRAIAAEALGNVKESEAIPDLCKALCDSNQHVRDNAAWALGKIGNPTAVPSLVEALLKDTGTLVRERAARALEKIRAPTATPGLLKALNDPDKGVRERAAKALEKIGKQAIPGLLEALHDPDAYVRRHACEALGGIGDGEAIPGLLEALHDPDAYVCKHAEKALQKITGQGK